MSESDDKWRGFHISCSYTSSAYRVSFGTGLQSFRNPHEGVPHAPRPAVVIVRVVDGDYRAEEYFEPEAYVAEIHKGDYTAKAIAVAKAKDLLK